jgi:amphi-Trp domain-containing protein
MLAPGSLDQDQELASAMAQTGQDVAYECRLQHLDGREIPIRVSRSAGMAADGTVKYHFMFIRPLEAEQTGPRTASAGTGPGVIRPIKPSEGAPVMSKNKVKLDTAITLPQAIAKLEELIDSLKQGTVNFQVGEEAVTVVPPDILHLEMKVAQKKEKERIKLELSWERSEEAAATGESSISSDPRIEMP